MKKKYILLLVMILPIIGKAYTGSSGMTYQECKAFSDNSVNIANSYEYKQCYRAGCTSSTSGEWSLMNMNRSEYRCANGNPEPQITISDGCASVTSGTCTLNSGIYCTVVRKINCNLTKDGKTYSNPNTTTASTSKQTVTVSSSKKTSKKSTSKKTSGSQTVKTTYATRPVVDDSTTTTTTARQISSNTNIKKVYINGHEQTFDNNTNEYTLNLPFGINNVEIKVETEDGYTAVEVIGADYIPDEDTDVMVTVTAEDGTKRNIIFHVKRYYELSKDCTLKYIKINDKEISKFDRNNFKYSVKTAKETTSLKMDVEPNDGLHSIYEIIGNKDLKNKSVITIKVTAENGDVCTYNITVKKSSNIWIPILIIIVIIGILIGVGYYVYGYMKRSKDQYKYE